jgi:hypothetical protein
LRGLTKLVETSVEEKTLESHLEKAFQELYRYNAEHYYLNLGIFLFCDNGQVVGINPDEVEFRDRKQAQAYGVNQGSVDYLISGFADVRYLRRAPSPVLYSMPCTVDNDDWSGLECPQFLGRGSLGKKSGFVTL